MKINKIELCNFRSASKVAFDFNDKLNLFVGVNGSGKSTTLDALSLCLTWLVKRIEKQNGRGKYISDPDLTIDQEKGYLDIYVDDEDTTYRWCLTKASKMSNSSHESYLGGVTKLAESIRESNLNNPRLPVIAYYPVNRVVGSIRPEIPDRDSIYNLDIYENALGGKANYHSFFEWFRTQDDLLNEEAMSRTVWIQRKRNWIKRRVHRILDSLIINVEKSFSNDEFNNLIKRFKKDEIIYEEPRFLFRELSYLIDTVCNSSQISLQYEKILHELEYMFHKMSSLSSEFRDDLIDEGGIHRKIVQNVIDQFSEISNERNSDTGIIDFLWETFSFATLVSLWWLSDKGRRDLEREFRRHERRHPQEADLGFKTLQVEFANFLDQIISKELRQKKTAHRSGGKELRTVASAIEQFTPDYRHLRVKRAPRAHMLIDKNGKTYNLNQLSDGEKSLIALVGDIARRLSIGNPDDKNPLKGNGVILIDEIDLHLHPSWQRLVIPKLLKVFPNCQFFISTHSPQVISHVPHESIFLLSQTNGKMEYQKAIESYGKNSDRILEDLLGVTSRPIEEKLKIRALFDEIKNGDLNHAKKIHNDLIKSIGEDPELVKASVLIKRKEILDK